MRSELPEIEIEGTEYLFDINQLALIEKERPEERKLFFDEMNDCGTHYEFVYNLNSQSLDPLRTQSGIDVYITGKHSFANVKVPRIGEIDPQGMSKKYNCSLDDIRKKSDFEIMVNQEAYDLRVNKGVLPTIEIAGHTFYVDLRMDKLRPKDDFLSNGIVFSDIERYYDLEKRTYTIPYNPKTHEFQEPDYLNLKELPKDLIAVRFSSERLLDRIGWNRKYGFEPTHGLKQTNLQIHFKSNIIPWQKTFVPQLIKRNLKEDIKKERTGNKPDALPKKRQGKRGRNM